MLPEALKPHLGVQGSKGVSFLRPEGEEIVRECV